MLQCVDARVRVLCLVFVLAGCGSKTTTAAGGDNSTGGDAVAAGGDSNVSGGDTFTAGDERTGDTYVAGDDDVGLLGDTDAETMTCGSCHGNEQNHAPPIGLGGTTEVTDRGVGAHQSHLATSSWHRTVECVECHQVPQNIDDAGHIDTPTPAEVIFAHPADADSAGPLDWDGDRCSNVYCHGTTLYGAAPGGVVNRTPEWTVVDGSYSSCGDTCHTNPPGAPHPAASACELCHDEVMSSYDLIDPANSVWLDANRHIDGNVDVANLTCTSCHGSGAAINPPVGTGGETQTSQAAVGAHEEHLQTATGWHADVQCTNCHTLPGAMLHTNGVTDFNWTFPATAHSATPSYTFGSTTCSNYCHGVTLYGPAVGRAPDWTVVDGTFDTCGSSCHENPPGAPHTSSDNCESCHGMVISSYDATGIVATWQNADRHIDGFVDATTYHDLFGWLSPRDGQDHHGSNYFLTNQQRDEHDVSCTACHGAALDGGAVGVSCNNAACHNDGDWRACDFCHGAAGEFNPPVGVGGETGINTLAVGRHVAHINQGYACQLCHIMPASGDITHTLEYVPSNDLSTAGHHGDVSFSGNATGMTWNVNATGGGPVNRRGTCVGACHSDGQGGAPAVVPYWAGGTWPANTCDNCHDEPPNNGEHNKHVNGEGFPCSYCHPDASSGSHINGQTNVDVSSEGAISFNPNACGSDNPGCSGDCHGENHNPECW